MEDIKKQEDINFEDKITKAKELLEKLSNPQITINESLKLYNEGLKELELAQNFYAKKRRYKIYFTYWFWTNCYWSSV
jgi:exodeoxyribonuclease VII small subunit